MSVTDAKGQTTAFAYNQVDQLVSTTNPLGQAKTFSYDLARNLTLVVDAKGQRIEFTYDAGNQLVQKVLKDPVGTVTDTVTFSYDSLGNLATATDNDSGLTFTYDPVGRLSQAQTAATASQPATTVSYTYDANGNRLSMTDPQAAVTSYAYDALNRLTSLTSPQGTTTFGYDALSRRTALNLPNGAKATYTYDAASQLKELLNTIGTTTISRFAYTYDAVGNRITRTTTNGIANYTYDALSRLTQATQPDPVDPLQQLTETFAYDPVGNRASSHLATAQVHDAANRLLDDSNFSFTYDANGNLVEQIAKANGDRTAYTYNVENQLIKVEKFTVAGGISPILTAAYRYDALGRRIAKEITQAGTTTITRYVYDNEDILLEFDGANLLQARYTHGPGIDEPLIMLRGTQRFFYHADGLGSVWDLTDGTGAAARSDTYDSFGQLLTQTGTLLNPYTYTGREFDVETGLYYYRARYYDPTSGRLLQEDPLGIFGAVNLYTYVNNRPTVFIDPNGLLLFGVTGTATANAGLVYGAAADVAGFAGIKISREGIGLGAAGSGGAFVGGPGRGIGVPGGVENKGGVVLGAIASLGGGFFFSNARSFADLEGTFRSFQLNAPFVSLQLDVSGDVFILSLTAGPSTPTASIVSFTTVTPQELIAETRSIPIARRLRLACP